MSLENLLLWLSAKDEGSWSQFREAVETLHIEQENDLPDLDCEISRPTRATPDFNIYQQIRYDLSRLAHVEFFSNNGTLKWRVVPPVIALLPASLNEGLLCGARSPSLLNSLEKLKSIEVIRTEATGMPARILLRGPSIELVKAAKELDFLIQESAPIAILSTVPAIRDPATWQQAQIPETFGWEIRRFSPSQLSWNEAKKEDLMKVKSGLFQFKMKYQFLYYLRWDAIIYSVSAQEGKYAVLRRRQNIVQYNPKTRVISFPSICRPPLLIERALVLCSGYLPQYEPSSKRLNYTSVPPNIARLAAQILKQEVR